MTTIDQIPDPKVRKMVQEMFSPEEVEKMIQDAQTPDIVLKDMQPMTRWGIRKIRDSLDLMEIDWRGSPCQQKA
jgi:hypothetical protein